MKRTVDRRVARTKEALRTALLELIERKGYDAISVQELVDHANVGRATFYSHYADKDDVLRENLGALGEHVRAQIDANESRARAPLAFSLPLLEHVARVKPMFVALLGTRGSLVVRQLFHEMVCELVDEEVGQAKGSAIPRRAVVQFLAASLLAVATWWVLEAPESEVGEVHRIYARLAGTGWPMRG